MGKSPKYPIMLENSSINDLEVILLTGLNIVMTPGTPYLDEFVNYQ